MASYNVQDVLSGLESRISRLRSDTYYKRDAIKFNKSSNYSQCDLQYIESKDDVLRQNAHETQDISVVYLYYDLSMYLSLSFTDVRINSKRTTGDISSVSISFYKGLHLITRLDWVNVHHNKDAELHPQPHWHVPPQQKEKDEEPSFVEPTEPSFEQQEESTEKKENYETRISVDALHLPMKSYKGDKELNSAKSFLEWVEEAISGFIEEYKYQKHKTKVN